MQDKTYYRAFEPAFVGANSSVHVCWISCILLTLKKNSFFCLFKKVFKLLDSSTSHLNLTAAKKLQLFWFLRVFLFPLRGGGFVHPKFERGQNAPPPFWICPWIQPCYNLRSFMISDTQLLIFHSTSCST